MKKLIYLLLLVPFCVNAQIVNIPDANFKAKLLNYNPVIDTNNDDEIQNSEALLVNTLVIEGVQITDLTGIQAFSNLTSLTVRYLQITSLDVSGLTNLQTLNCSKNSNLNSLNLIGLTNLQILNCYDCDAIASLNLSGLTSLNNLNASDISSLTSLDLSNLPNLQIVNLSSCINLISLPNFSGSSAIQDINCSNCRLQSINLSGLINLQTFNCAYCDLATLDASNLPSLTTLNCSQNGPSGPGSPNTLTTLNLTGSYALTNLICGANSFASIDIANHTNLTYLDCAYSVLTSLEINNLTNLTYLNCSNNSITSLDVSNLTNLSELNCSYNQISTLAVSNLLNLTKIDCSQNQLTALDVAPLLQLTELRCRVNQITSLNLLPLIQLTVVNADSNPLNTLNISTLTNLLELYCNDCQLSSIDVTNAPLLTRLSCGSNPITSVDISNQPNLKNLSCSNTLVSEIDLSHIMTPIFPQASTSYTFHLGFNPNLTYINLKNGGNHVLNNTNFSAGDCPNLNFICSDEQNINAFKFSLNGNNGGPMGTINVNLIQFNSYCSFTPGGTYNTISGTVTIDTDNNGCDNFDYMPNDVKVSINDGSTSGATFTSNNGNFTFFNQTGSFTITPQFQNPYFIVNPASATLNFPTLDGSTQTQNFCISPNGIHNDLEVIIAPLTPARPGFDAVYKIVYKNNGNQVLSGDVSLTFDDDKTDFVTSNPNPDNLNLNSLTWNYTNLLPFENRVIMLTLNVNGPTETPAVNIGDVLHFTTTINPTAGDEFPNDNAFNYNQIVVGSYDPNNIECLEGEVVAPSYIGQYLHYAVNFENTGNFPAENVVVKIIIDTTKYDMNSLQLLNVSHNSYTRITGNIVEVIFQQINLDSGGHGNLLFKIRTNSNLVVGNAVAKRADIFFDYNAPIDTGMANTTFQALSNSIFELDNSISIYPNPTNGKVNIKVNINVNDNSNNTIKSVELYDVQGRLLQTQLLDEVQTSIDISEKSNGIYFLKITSDKGSKVEKIMKK